MTAEQKAVLEEEYERNPTNWTPQFVTGVALRLGLNRTKVYKWHWDYRKLIAARDGEADIVELDDQ